MTNSYKFDDGIHWALLPTKNWGPLLTFIFCGLMFAFAIGDVYYPVHVFLTTGNFSYDFPEILTIAIEPHSAWKSVAIAVALTLNSLFIFSNWMVFIPGLVGCMVIQAISTEYSRYISKYKGDDERFLKVLETYKVVKKLVKDINKIWSFYVFLVIVCMMADFCNHFPFLIGDKTATTSGDGWLTRAILLLYFLLLTICFLLAAEAHQQFQKVDKYILKNIGNKSNTLDRKVEGVILQNDISQNPLGVRAHHFMLSYSVLATILSTVMTYIFIFLQFQSAAKS